MSRQIKLSTIIRDIERTEKIISDSKKRLEELKKLKLDTENKEILGIIRGEEISPDELREIIRQYMLNLKETEELKNEV